MEAKELMLGDIVYYVTKRGKDLVSIEQVDPNVPAYKKCEPVLITPKILEKNGFVESDNIGTYYYTDKDGNYIQYDFDERKLLVEAAESTFDGVILYVHKMQHVFTLCEVEKEIELL